VSGTKAGGYLLPGDLSPGYQMFQFTRIPLWVSTPLIIPAKSYKGVKTHRGKGFAFTYHNRGMNPPAKESLRRLLRSQ